MIFNTMNNKYIAYNWFELIIIRFVHIKALHFKLAEACNLIFYNNLGSTIDSNILISCNKRTAGVYCQMLLFKL